MNDDVTCVILAGGLARRMGNVDKAFVTLNNKPLLSHVLKTMLPQAAKIIINANGDPARFSDWNLPVVADTIADFPGPLAGILAAMEWAKVHNQHCKWIASIPVDTPFAPPDLILRLARAIKDDKADLACARSNGRDHPVVGLWPVKLADDLREAMTRDGIRKVDLWTGRFKLAHCDFETTAIDPFFNINRPEDIADAEKILQKDVE